MKRWHTASGKEVVNDRIDAFLAEVETLCQKHGFSISHEDDQGAFGVVNYNKADSLWLQNAHDATVPPRKQHDGPL